MMMESLRARNEVGILGRLSTKIICLVQKSSERAKQLLEQYNEHREEMLQDEIGWNEAQNLESDFWTDVALPQQIES
ncbi:hypothetical protein VTP01DRAFT_9908 [Rhizomucor pusillus]|uniref:uncharacterized protein n=1 Tax=Rhizomucor pusillus TaxID=4840 RepID=UPI0037423388